MRKSPALAASLVVGAVAVASVFAAAPASAATLPAGQKITVIDSNFWQFFEANPADAALTAVGTAGAANLFVSGVDVDDTGHGYAVATDFSEGPVAGYVLTADATTGTLSNAVPVTLNFGDVFPAADECTAIDYTGGALIAACQIYSDFDATYVGTLDPTSGVLTPFIELNGGEDFPFLYITAIATDPTTGTLYGYSWDFPSSSGVQWVLGDDLLTGGPDIFNPVWGADFDRDGQLWITTDEPEDGNENPEFIPSLATQDLVSGANPFLAFFNLGGVTLSGEDVIQPITVWGALAPTGAVQSPAGAVGAGALLLFGAIMAAGAMAIRRRSVES